METKRSFFQLDTVEKGQKINLGIRFLPFLLILNSEPKFFHDSHTIEAETTLSGWNHFCGMIWTASCKSCTIVAQVAATPDLDPNIQASTESETTTSSLDYVCSIHSGLPAPCNVTKSQQRTTPRTYQDSRQGSTIHPSSTGSCWQVFLVSGSRYCGTCRTVRNTPDEALLPLQKTWGRPTYYSSFAPCSQSNWFLSGSNSCHQNTSLPEARSNTRNRAKIKQRTLEELHLETIQDVLNLSQVFHMV